MNEWVTYKEKFAFESIFIDTPDGTLHAYRWGKSSNSPCLILLHGWFDSGISWQFLADCLAEHAQLIALDWRGFGRSMHCDRYYFPDYLLDLDRFLEIISPLSPVYLIGHSMGAMVANLYAGIRPERVAKLISIEGFGLQDRSPNDAPIHYAKWLKSCREFKHDAPNRSISLETFRIKLLQRNPHLPHERAAWLAEQLTQPTPDGRRILRADSRHRLPNPVLYRLEESRACWKAILAPVLWIYGAVESDHPAVHSVLADLPARRACFRQLSEHYFEHCGHMIHWEQPEKLAHAVRKFLNF